MTNELLIKSSRRVSSLMNLNRSDLRSKSRKQLIVFARMIFSHICYKELGISQVEISKFLKRNQSNINYLVKQTEVELTMNKNFAVKYEKSKEKILKALT